MEHDGIPHRQLSSKVRGDALSRQYLLDHHSLLGLATGTTAPSVFAGSLES